ncbi:hypothetical protein PIB30_087093 [Stylosanthes scabra]|uniref:Uncharacterized protein n=1 Tax=Stylosanthes scabra TaxID=79078 RepID=A0ABU6WUD4_9FABA|nr:hypothetical protein [Stylosanthes scabra]
MDCWHLAENLGKVGVVATGNAVAAAALLLLHCLLPLEALVQLHQHLLAIVGAHFLIVLGKLKFPLPCNPCAITAMLSAMISSAPHIFYSHNRMYKYGPCHGGMGGIKLVPNVLGNSIGISG